MKPARLISVGLLLVAVLLGVACCGGEAPTTDAKLAGMDQQLVNRGNAICKRSTKERGAELEAAKPNPPKNDRQELVMLVTRVYVPSLEKMTAKLEQAEHQAGGSAEAMAIIAAFKKGTETRKRNPAKALEELAFSEADRLAKKFGWIACSEIG
jgi:hypothetical protein